MVNVYPMQAKRKEAREPQDSLSAITPKLQNPTTQKADAESPERNWSITIWPDIGDGTMPIAKSWDQLEAMFSFQHSTFPLLQIITLMYS